jgi:hypothetical protein
MDDFEKGIMLNMQNGNYEVAQMTVEDARAFFDAEHSPAVDDFYSKLDEAQGKVHSGDHNITLLILVITKD